MGKRELLLILGFVVVGVVVYQATAPPRDPNARRFSWSRWFHDLRSDIHGNAMRVEIRRRSTTALTPGQHRLEILDFRGSVTIRGEDRSDLAAELRAQVSGADETDAQAQGERVQLAFEPSGDAVRLRASLEDMRRYPQLELTVLVPRNMTARVDLRNGQLQVQAITGLTIDTRNSNVSIRDLEGAVEGDHRDGSMQIENVGSVRLRTTRSEVRVDQVLGESAVELRDGRLRGERLGGTSHIRSIDARVELEDLAGATTVTASESRVTVQTLRAPLTIDGRDTEVRIDVATPTTITASTTDETLELRLATDIGVRLDVRAQSGDVLLPDGLKIETLRMEGAERAAGDVAGGGPLVQLRNVGGNIVIRY